MFEKLKCTIIVNFFSEDRLVDSNLCVFFERTEGRSLFVFIKEHCFAKKLLNISAFCLKSVKVE